MGKKLPSHVLRYTVLKIFQEGPSYGYEVVSRIEEITDGYWIPSYGTIYPLVQRLEDEGLLRPLDQNETEKKGLDGDDRNYFELTDEGHEEVAPEEDEDEQREKFEDLILGYLKIYQNKYGEEKLEKLFERI